MKIRIHSIKPKSYVDGPGERTVVFVQGCAIGCKGCQNRALWPAEGGYLVEAKDLAQTLVLTSKSGNYTISGGEPFNQVKPLAELVRELRRLRPQCSIILYSGYTWEVITSGMSGYWLAVQEILDNLDILVDGPFIREQDDDLITWRGSRNQRPIDVQASLKAGAPVVLDWDSPEIVLDPEGAAILPVGLAVEFSGLGEQAQTRMCGQTKG